MGSHLLWRREINRKGRGERGAKGARTKYTRPCSRPVSDSFSASSITSTKPPAPSSVSEPPHSCGLRTSGLLAPPHEQVFRWTSCVELDSSSLKMRA